MRTETRHPDVKSDALYLTDNGAVYCGDDLGASASMTMRDISGQKIEELTPKMAAEAKAAYGWTPACEACGRTATA